MTKPVGGIQTFAGVSPPWNLSLLDANFAAFLSAINDVGTYSNYLVDGSGAANQLTVATPGSVTFSLVAGALLQVKVANTTTSSTVNMTVNGGANTPVTGLNGVALTVGQLTAGGVFLLLYDGTEWQVLNAISYGRTPAEIAASVTPVNYAYAPGDVRRHGMIGDSGTTDNTTFFQNALNANAGFGPVVVPTGTGYYKLTGRVTAPANTRIIMASGAELRWTATTATGTNFLGAATRPGIEVMGDNFLIEGRGKITGPATAAAGSGAGGGGVTAVVTNEVGLFRIGTSAAARGTGFIVRDVEISLWGAYGILTQFMQDIQLIGNVIHDVGYSGTSHLSAQNVKEYYNKIYGVAPGSSGNAYGITHSHDSTNYSSDPNVTAAPRQTVNPFCIDMDCGFNEIRDIPLWIALDAHGCYEGRYHHNTVYNCYRGLQIAGSSGAAANYAGENNRIEDNVIYSQQINGNATTVATGYQSGITVNGGSVLTHRGVIVARNHLVGMGHASNTPSVFCIEHTYCDGVVIANNTFHGCVGRGTYGSNSSGTIVNNYWDSVGASATGSYCIYIDSNSGAYTVTGNVHSPRSGTLTAYTNGIQLSSVGMTRIVFNGNDFTACTNPALGLTNLTRGNSDIVPQVVDTTTGSHTIDVSVFGLTPKIVITGNQGSPATLTSLLNPQVNGQEAKILMVGGTTLTVNNSGNIKLQGGSRALTSSSTLTLNWDGAKWQETACTLGNT